MAFTPGTLLEKRTRRSAFAALVFVLSPWPVLAQAMREARLLVTVVDQTRAVLPDAKVSVVGLDAATKNDVAPVQTSGQGVATIVGLPPGRYLIQAEFPGFNAGVLPDVRVRAGDNRQTITLAIQGLQDSVTVDRDRQQTAADRRNTFGGTPWSHAEALLPLQRDRSSGESHKSIVSRCHPP